MSIADGRLSFLHPFMPRGHLLFYTPHAGGTLSCCLRVAYGFLAKVRKRPLGLGTLLGSSLRLGHSCEPYGTRLPPRLGEQKGDVPPT